MCLMVWWCFGMRWSRWRNRMSNELKVLQWCGTFCLSIYILWWVLSMRVSSFAGYIPTARIGYLHTNTKTRWKLINTVWRLMKHSAFLNSLALVRKNSKRSWPDKTWCKLKSMKKSESVKRKQSPDVTVILRLTSTRIKRLSQKSWRWQTATLKRRNFLR